MVAVVAHQNVEGAELVERLADDVVSGRLLLEVDLERQAGPADAVTSFSTARNWSRLLLQ